LWPLKTQERTIKQKNSNRKPKKNVFKIFSREWISPATDEFRLPQKNRFVCRKWNLKFGFTLSHLHGFTWCSRVHYLVAVKTLKRTKLHKGSDKFDLRFCEMSKNTLFLSLFGLVRSRFENNGCRCSCSLNIKYQVLISICH
jgi:hypothetical protein